MDASFNPIIYDLSRIICFLLPVTTSARWAFNSSHNLAQRAPLVTPEHEPLQLSELSLTDGNISIADDRETTPLVDPFHDAVTQVLSLTTDVDRLYNQTTGHIFGSRSDDCDIILDVNCMRGVSSKHFRLFIDPKEGQDHNLTLQNLSGNFIEAISLETKVREKLGRGEQLILQGGEWTITLHVQVELALKLIFPDHGQAYLEYKRNWAAFRAANLAASNAKPSSMIFAHPTVETPLVQKAPFTVSKVLLGEGASGTVWQASGQNGAVLAAKIFKNRLESQKELQILKVVRHRYIVVYKAFMQERDHDIIIMEYLSGGTLAAKLKASDSSVPLVRFKLYWAQLAEGLRYLHSKRILHRDLKPGNILFDAGGTLKICDFGISKQLSASKDNTNTQLGSPHYVAPEVLDGLHYNYPSDIWSLGIVVLEMYRQLPPRTESWRIAAGRTDAWDRWLSAVQRNVRDLPEDMKLLKQHLSIDPGQRPGAEVVAAELRRERPAASSNTKRGPVETDLGMKRGRGRGKRIITRSEALGGF